MSAGRVLGEGLSVKWSDKFGKPERGKSHSMQMKAASFKNSGRKWHRSQSLSKNKFKKR
jgi:hypothetical protein